MRLAATALDRCRRFVAADEMIRQIETALGEHRRAVGQLLGVPHDVDVALHVLARPAARMRDVGKLRKDEAELGEEAEHLPGHRLDVVLSADDDKARHLVADQHLIAGRHRVLHAVEPLGHLEIERGGRAPADRRCDDDGVGPVHQRLVDLIHLIVGVHLGDRARPGARPARPSSSSPRRRGS